MYPNGTCKNCGGPLLGDGFKTVLHCEFADVVDVWETEPDAAPILCPEPEPENENPSHA